MLKAVKDTCQLHPMALNYTAKDQIENLLDLINQEGDDTVFFQKNFVTSGMTNLFQIGMKRLAGLSDQAVCHLVQAMGGGKTHMMIALGLLARDRYDIFGNLPDVIDDDWIDDIETLDRKLAEYIERRKKANAFELRYGNAVDPKEPSWETCSQVLARQDIIERLSKPW